jgi:hypothetical protein
MCRVDPTHTPRRDFGTLPAIMASPETWLDALSTAKAVFESIKSGVDFLSALKKYRGDPETIRESRRVSEVFSTFSESEVSAITKRLEECRRRFAAEGDGKRRAACFCSVFEDVRDGNGEIRPIDDWQNMSRQLCSRK